MASADKSTAVGIDLGTTYSCVAAFYNGKIRVIPNEQGNHTTPSYVAFTDERRLIGDAAKNQVNMNIWLSDILRRMITICQTLRRRYLEITFCLGYLKLYVLSYFFDFMSLFNMNLYWTY
jgi:hypothetical protein